jgi:Uma2 family endonuclease
VSEPATLSRMSAAEYLQMERASVTKHELWDGEAFAMAGATFVHNQIVGNLTRALGNLVLDGPCIVLPSDMKIHVPLTNAYVYPDVSVVCTEPQYVGDASDVITNPRVIVEVLSTSTEGFDRGEKFVGYRSLPSMVDYLLVAQARARVEHYVRGDDGTWVFRELGPGERLHLAGINGELPVDEIYRKVSLR